jgi:hypothetical protein
MRYVWVSDEFGIAKVDDALKRVPRRLVNLEAAIWVVVIDIGSEYELNVAFFRWIDLLQPEPCTRP